MEEKCSNYKIRNASFEDMSFILSLANKEGWNPGINDARAFWEIDPNGYFIIEVNSMPAGCISAVKYNEKYGFIGLYIMLPAFRHQGYGIKLWNKALDYLGNITIGLDGVIERQEDYKKSQFKLYYENARFEGRLHTKENKELIPLSDISFETLSKYDTSIFGMSRDRFLKKWINEDNTFSLSKLEKNQMVGFGVIRKCIKGYKIGPLFADNKTIAKEILEGLVAKIGYSPFYLDVPELNKDALELVQNYMFRKVFSTARMYKNNEFKQNLNKIYGVTTFEVG